MTVIEFEFQIKLNNLNIMLSLLKHTEVQQRYFVLQSLRYATLCM